MCFVLLFPNMSYYGMYPKGINVGPRTTFHKAQQRWSRATPLSDDVHNRCWLFFGHFGPDVAFSAKPQRLPFLRWSAEFSWGLSLFVNGLSGLHAGSVILGFFQVAPSLWMKMGLEISVVTHRMWVPSNSTDGQVEGEEQKERSCLECLKKKNPSLAESPLH